MSIFVDICLLLANITVSQTCFQIFDGIRMLAFIAALLRFNKKRFRKISQRHLRIDLLESRIVFSIGVIKSAVDVDSNSGNESSADVAMFADGSYVAIYHQSSSISARRFSAQKEPIGSQFTIVADSGTKSYSQAKIAAADADKFVVVYEEYDSSNSDTDVFFKLYAGTTSLTSGQVNPTDESKNQSGASVAMSDNGSFVVSYQHEYSLDDSDVYFRVYNSSGAPITSAAAASGANSTKNEIRSSVAMSGDGSRLGIGWQSVKDTNLRDNVRISIYSVVGSTVGLIVGAKEVPETGVGTNDHENPSLAMDLDGDLAVAWIKDINGNEEVWKRTFSPSGFINSEIKIAGPATVLDDPKIAVGDDGFRDYAIAYENGEDVFVAGVTDSFNTFNFAVSNFSWIERNPQIDMQGQSFVITYIDKLSGENAKAKSFGQTKVGGRNGNEIGGFTAASGAVYVGIASPTFIASYSPAVTWVDAITADFNNDGLDELAMRVASTGEWWITSASSGTTRWTTWAPSANWINVQKADINGDNRDDIIGRTSSGAWYAALSTGTTFTNVYLGVWAPGANWQDVLVGDFDGDFRDDIVGRVAANGQWWLARSSGSTSAPTISNVLLGSWAPVAWSNVRVGDFNDDGKDDILGQFNGAWWLGASNGASITTTNWAIWSGSVTWNDVLVGDFNQDGKDDVAGRVGSSGSWWVGISTGTAFTTQNWVNWGGTSWNHIRVFDVNGDGRNDIVGWDASTGEWWVGVSTGKKFVSVRWGAWSNAVTWNTVRVVSF